jgi:hypothetical protein
MIRELCFRKYNDDRKYYNFLNVIRLSTDSLTEEHVNQSGGGRQ